MGGRYRRWRCWKPPPPARWELASESRDPLTNVLELLDVTVAVPGGGRTVRVSDGSEAPLLR